MHLLLVDRFFMPKKLTFKPTKIKNSSGGWSWQVYCGRKAGKQVRPTFPTKAEAQTYAELMRVQRTNEGSEALQLPFDVRAQAIAAYKRLEEVGRITGTKVSLSDAVEYFIAHSMPTGGAKTCQEVLQELLVFKKVMGRSDEYIDALKWSVGKFCRTFGNHRLHEVGAEDCHRWLVANTDSVATHNAYIRDVGILFSHGLRRKYCASNPMREVEKPQSKGKDIVCLSIPQVKRLLQASEEHSDLGILPYVTIGLFCGIRDCELAKLEWKYVSLTEKIVTISKDIAKGRRIRHVDIPPSLLAWLRPVAQTEGRVAPAGLRGKLQALREAAGFSGGNWGDKLRNAVRHSYASYHVAAHQNAAQTALQLGHRNQDLLFDHYRALATKEDAKLYWAMYPSRDAV